MKSVKVETNASPRSLPPPWSGNLGNIDTDKPGLLLLSALFCCAQERGSLPQDMARELGVTYGYISQLMNGVVSIDSIPREFEQACAEYLQVPRIVILQLSGCITNSDFYSDEAAFKRDVELAIAYISSDLEWGALLKPCLRSAEFDIKVALIKMYEAASGKLLISAALGVNQGFSGISNQLSNLRREDA